MMKFSISRTNARFINKVYIYFAMSILIAIGIGILFISLSNLESENRLYNKTYKALQQTTTTIEPLMTGLNSIDYYDYLHLNDKYKDVMNVFYSASTKVNFMSKEDDLVSINCVFITDDEIKELSGLTFDDGVIIGKAALDNLKKLSDKNPIAPGKAPDDNEYIILDTDMRYKNNGIIINGENFPFKTIDTKYETRVMAYNTDMLWNGTSDALRLGYTIFLPIDKINDYKDNLNPNHMMTRIAIKEKNPNTNNLWEILDYLSKEHPDINYKLNDQHARAKDRLSQMTWNANRYKILSLLLIVLISVASSGLFYIIYYKRKVDIAVSIAMGSTFRLQKFELLLEISYVVLFGFIIGISGGSMIADILNIQFKFEIVAFLITLFVSVLIIIISSFLSINSLKKLSPTSILQSM